MLDFMEYIHSRKVSETEMKLYAKKEGSYPMMNPQTRNIIAAITPARIPYGICVTAWRKLSQPQAAEVKTVASE